MALERRPQPTCRLNTGCRVCWSSGIGRPRVNGGKAPKGAFFLAIAILRTVGYRIGNGLTLVHGRTFHMPALVPADRLPKMGKVYRYRNLIFWAQDGCICIEDERPELGGDFRVVSRPDFAATIILFRDSYEKGGYAYAEMRNEDHNFIVNGCAAVKEAKRQGDPNDPRVIESKMREHRRTFFYTGDTTGHLISRPIRDGNMVIKEQQAAIAECKTLRRLMVQEEAAHAALLPPIPVSTKPHILEG